MPAFFQRRMDFFFGKYDFIVVYIDDILIHSQNLENHMKHLQIFLDEVKKHSIVLSEKKMVLFQDSIDFLGIHVINGKIQMQPHVLTKLSELPDELQDTKIIQRFLGVLNYVHKYIPILSEKTTSIRKHLNSGWSPEATTTVNLLKAECKQLLELKPLVLENYILWSNATHKIYGKYKHTKHIKPERHRYTWFTQFGLRPP